MEHQAGQMVAWAPGLSCPARVLSTLVTRAMSLEGRGSSLGTWVAGVMGRVARPVLGPFPVSRSLKDARRLAGSLAGWTPLIGKLLTCVLNPTPRPFARGQNQELLRRPAEHGKHDFLFRSS